MATSSFLDVIRGVATAPDLKEWPVPVFVQSIDLCEGDLVDSFLSSTIKTVCCYRSAVSEVFHRPDCLISKSHLQTHEYLIVCVDPSTVMNTSLWLRIERRPIMESIPLLMAVSSSADLGAQDTITLSSSVGKLRGLAPQDKMVMSLAREGSNPDSVSSPAPQVRHIIALLRIVQNVSPRYSILSFNCRWLARVVVNAFILYHGMTDMAGAPITGGAELTNKIDKLTSVIGKNTEKATKEVWDEFQRLFHSQTSSSSRERHEVRQSELSTLC